MFFFPNGIIPKKHWLVVCNMWIIVPSLGNFIISTDELIFLRGVAQPPTSFSVFWNFGSQFPWDNPNMDENWGVPAPLRLRPCKGNVWASMPFIGCVPFRRLKRADAWRRISLGRFTRKIHENWGIISGDLMGFSRISWGLMGFTWEDDGIVMRIKLVFPSFNQKLGIWPHHFSWDNDGNKMRTFDPNR